MTNPSRRQFLLIITSGAAVLGAAACGGGGGGGGGNDGGGNVDCSTVTPTIQGNHTPGHSVTIVEADVTAGTAHTYTLSDAGIGPHSHMLTVTASMFADLAAGMTVTAMTTTTSNHSHVVTIRCA